VFWSAQPTRQKLHTGEEKLIRGLKDGQVPVCCILCYVEPKGEAQTLQNSGQLPGSYLGKDTAYLSSNVPWFYSVHEKIPRLPICSNYAMATPFYTLPTCYLQSVDTAGYFNRENNSFYGSCLEHKNITCLNALDSTIDMFSILGNKLMTYAIKSFSWRRR
jgi:hypothetical protein